MTSRITRRDFLNGAALAVGSGLVAPAELLARAGAGPGDAAVGSRAGTAAYPPTLTGLRGSHPGSFEVAHALAWRGEKPATYRALDEHYDLAVVGAGISGLAAARFWRQRMGPDARILLLDNHDDFGGHARRNEFHHDGRMVLNIGGAQNLENHSAYSDVAKGLLEDLGVNRALLAEMQRRTPGDSILMGSFGAANAFSVDGPDGRVTVGGDWLQFMLGEGDFAAGVRALPVAEDDQRRLLELLGGERDFLEDLSLGEKYEYVNAVSYNSFLTERVGLAPSTVPLMDGLLRLYYGCTGWSLSVFEAVAVGAAGLKGMGWFASMLGSLAASFAGDIMDIRVFPDGNATVARLLVRDLIPAVAPGSEGIADIAVSRFDYGALDAADHPVRLRLSSTAVGVRETGGRVEVDYVRHGEAERVTADHCVLACYNGIIPHLCPELPEAQQEALRYGVKVPFAYASVLLGDGRALAGLGANWVTCPNDPFVTISAAPPSAVGGYEPPRGPDDPMALFMVSAPTPAPSGEETVRDLSRVGRSIIYATPFAEYERQIRTQLQGVLGPHGFDHERDVRAITVNRHPHGYAYGYTALNDPEWPEGRAPHELGRARFGRISIANSDSEARAYIDAAIDAAWRAVGEQTAGA